jgi:hypothetical protein
MYARIKRITEPITIGRDDIAWNFLSRGPLMARKGWKKISADYNAVGVFTQL